MLKNYEIIKMESKTKGCIIESETVTSNRNRSVVARKE
jgi:hypothetical protein